MCLRHTAILAVPPCEVERQTIPQVRFLLGDSPVLTFDIQCSRRSFLAGVIVVVSGSGCYESSESTMENSTSEPTANSKQWQLICTTNGWEFIHHNDGVMPEWLASLMKSRHANNPVFENRELTELQESEYDDLNQLLHSRMTEVAREHFCDVPLPLEYESQGEWAVEFAWKIGTPFTYQNLDWYGPTYECFITILESYVSSTLVNRFQQQLCDVLTDWGIVVCSADDTSFDPREVIHIYGDRVTVWEGDIENVPAPQS
ncbi:MAG: hypothetical protein ACI8P0_001267 [Planctomycetaceae bacterium]